VRKVWPSLFKAVVVVAVSLLCLELMLQTYVTVIAKRGKLFDYDAETGWHTLPNLDLIRLNAANQEWSIRTDSSGLRTLANQLATDRRNLLILGDSFAFGEGVMLEARFDAYIKRAMPDLNIVNTGTPGFGTDQEYVLGRKFFKSLHSEDVILVLLYVNDFYDVLRKEFALRSKPYFVREGDQWQLRNPDVGIFQWLRDRSYLIAVLGQLFEAPPESAWDFDAAQSIVTHILERIAAEKPSPVSVVLAYHGRLVGVPWPANIRMSELCMRVASCIDLDPALDEKTDFLPDGHWTPSGHKSIGERLAGALKSLKK
jgi:hypothetical protein